MSSQPIGKRICFISARSGWIRNERQVLMDESNASLIEALSLRTDYHLTLAIVDHEKEEAWLDHELTVAGLYKLPKPFSYAGGLVNIFHFQRVLKTICRENDVLIVQLPFIGFLALLLVKKPVVYHICANVLTAASNPVKYRGISRIASSSFARIMHFVYKRLFRRRNACVITNGDELASIYRDYSPRAVISSSLYRNDILSDQEISSRVHEPVRLLFVGRPSLEKGFDTLLEALMNFKMKFLLTVVGFNDEEYQLLLPRSHESTKEIHTKLNFTGHVGWSNGLKEIIRSQDIALIPSRSEGTPRVILECMSQGVAVIASRVGGIPTVIKHQENGLLVTPGVADDLRAKIEYLVEQPDYRKSLILRGLETARQNTIDDFASHFERAIEDLNE